ncbi:MAG: 4Fe-4S cluster-binding domain-containing protein [Oscillospiraceae bacterium]|nr:4Fe-4S cluster-binding domain-containing protein [Oscillospiraceae bacterium]
MSCQDCPRSCAALRSQERSGGFCRCYSLPCVTRAAPHFGEEPCISGTAGAGAVFFSGCNLRCVYCQNREISRAASGKMLTVRGLQDVMLRLQDSGVHNIELVTPTQHSRVIAEALAGIHLEIPVIWNSSAYESVETLRMLEGLVQIYMPDMKYWHSETAAKFSSAPDYPVFASAAIQEMFRQRGPYQFDENGLLRSGLLIRHLILPGHTEESMDVIDFVADSFPQGSVLFSLMSQYTPMVSSEAFPELSRCVTAEENRNLIHYMQGRHITDGYWQEISSSGVESIPEFDGSGLDN